MSALLHFDLIYFDMIQFDLPHLDRVSDPMSYQPSYRPASSTSSLAVVSLVFGILAWCLLPFVGAIVAIICGHMARSEIRKAAPDAVIEGDGLAIAGLVLGYAHLALFVLGMFVLLAFGFAFLHWH